jgi:ribosomal protein S25
MKIGYKRLIEEYINLLEMTNENLRKQKEFLSRPEKEKRQGVVYVFRQEGTDNYKIGFSANYEQRKNIFGIKLPFNMKEVAVYNTDYYKEAEAGIHNHFSDARLNGSEFFTLTPEQLEEIPVIIKNVEDIESEEIDADDQEEQEGEEEARMTDEDILNEATILVRKEGRASASLLQRKLKLGYTRASRVMDMLEEKGIVGPGEGAKPRTIIEVSGEQENTLLSE